ncbi:MAG: hypothetical protein MUQ10_20170 [Anaerolineae bacterium]|nr:hypothetical protein [Anaerolineae bacterium]
MIQVTGPHPLEFFPVDLDFITRAEVYAFARENNKTVAETLAHERYSQLQPIILERHSAALNDPPGSFLQELKPTGDPFYLQFLDSCGIIGSTFTFSPSSNAGPAAQTGSPYHQDEVYCTVLRTPNTPPPASNRLRLMNPAPDHLSPPLPISEGRLQ